MNARRERLLAGLALAAGLATLAGGCAGPYHPQIESRVLERPEPPLTPADQEALAPYLNSPYFRDHP